MKKSKFLKNSRDMLSRSFNPSKCKTSLRLAGSRLKLLRNKKEVQLKQMKREISQLLESGQDQTARIRVEHVAREEKMISAYDLIEIYCELIVARLPIIESQKICPIDLKEAIASVVFASPRCGDVPELGDVRKHFTEKYGKDFVTAALELRPDCGVSRMLVEKLSAVAPDGHTKTKMLSAIAEEHNVKWDPKSFQENSVPESDFLNGRSPLGKEQVEPSHFGGPDIQAPQHNKVNDSPLKFTQTCNRTSLEPERIDSSRTSGISTSFLHEASRPADERAQFFQDSSNTLSLDRHRWSMEFKDATSAAQIAAESAELATMAARAAAQLSSGGRITRQYSTESHNSDCNNVLKDGGPRTYMNSEFFTGKSSEEPSNRSFLGHTRSQNARIDRMKPNNLKTDGRFGDSGHAGTKEYGQSASLKSIASTKDDSFDHGVPVVDRYYRENSMVEEPRGEVSVRKQSFMAERANDLQEKSENVRSSHSHSSISNYVNIFSNSKGPHGALEDSFTGFGRKGVYGEDSQTDLCESAAVVFDKSDSDSEYHTYDTSPTYDEPKQGFHLPLPGQKSHDQFSAYTNSWSPRSSTSKTLKSSSPLFLNRKSSSPDFSERSMHGQKPDDSIPVAFDESDGPSSESDEDKDISRHRGSQYKDKSGPSVGSPIQRKGTPGLHRKQSSPSFDDGDRERNQLMSKQIDRERNRVTGDSNPESEGGLNFGRLTGGFRHKGYSHPSYLMKQFDVSSSFNNGSEETTVTAPPALEHKKSRMPHLQSESDSDSSEEEESLRKSSDHKKEIYTGFVGKEDVKTKPSPAASNSIFGSDNSDTDKDIPKESLGRISHLRNGISRRTKASPSSLGKNIYSIMQFPSDTLNCDDGMDRRKPINRVSSESQQQFQSVKGNPTINWQDQYNLGKANPSTIQESNVTQKSAVSRENLKASTLNKTSSDKDSSSQNASHVHPKLPDYDTLVQSLRKNRS